MLSTFSLIFDIIIVIVIYLLPIVIINNDNNFVEISNLSFVNQLRNIYGFCHLYFVIVIVASIVLICISFCLNSAVI